ncbi:hypothetical protein FOA52_014604 [Chlamydomonas sp. UWO 241]|nr:hypothetical protein FOA52_014604 [Chlamydomonas sp. UWO 241]
MAAHFPPLSAANLKPCFHQVGGHMANDSEPESYVDDEGRFYKPYTDGPRAEREIQFYHALFLTDEMLAGTPRPNSAYPSATDTAPEGTPHTSPDEGDLEGLRPFVPRFYGTLAHGGKNLLALEDMARQYKKPCVLDVKMGFSSVYPWAEQRYITKFNIKDAETTQASCGFRISGFKVYRPATGEWFQPDRQWGRDRTKDNVGDTFTLFASGEGGISAKDLWGHAALGALAPIRAFTAWAHKQTSFRFYQASLLIMYEGEATKIEDAHVRVSYVDFAHCFQSLGQNDENLSTACDSLVTIINTAIAADEALAA